MRKFFVGKIRASEGSEKLIENTEMAKNNNITAYLDCFGSLELKSSKLGHHPILILVSLRDLNAITSHSKTFLYFNNFGHIGVD